LPTITPSITPQSTPTATVTATCTILPGSTDIGNHCDNCITGIALPFPVQFYGQSFTSANISSNGNLQLNSSDTTWTNTCLPDTLANYAMFPYWDDLLLTGTNQGIYTLLTGTAPNLTFYIEWTGGYFSGVGTIDMEVSRHEWSTTFEYIYG